MDLDNRKSLALQCCIEIYKDYELHEVEKFAPPSVVKAWELGKDYMEFQRKQDRKKLKDFKL